MLGKKFKEQRPRVRHELKYIVSTAQAEEIRKYLRVFCIHDPFSGGDPPFYEVTSLYLDSPGLAFHLAKERKQLNRFKLRLRTYRDGFAGTVFFEVKRKEEQIIRKTRSRVQRQDYHEDLFQVPYRIPFFEDEDEFTNHCEFLRLMKVADARPMVHIHYERESWIGLQEPDIRFTLDRNIRYRRADGYILCNGTEKGWRSMDTETALRRPFGGVVLEIKSSILVPSWILNMVRYFDLQRTGFCKYSTAMRLESLFSGQTYTAGSERCNL